MHCSTPKLKRKRKIDSVQGDSQLNVLEEQLVKLQEINVCPRNNNETLNQKFVKVQVINFDPRKKNETLNQKFVKLQEINVDLRKKNEMLIIRHHQETPELIQLRDDKCSLCKELQEEKIKTDQLTDCTVLPEFI